MPIEVAVRDAYRTTGESPHWEEHSQSLYYVDINANSVHCWNSQTKVVQSITLDKTIGFAVPCTSGGVIIGLGKTLSHLDWNTKQITVLHEVDQDKNDNRFNDGKCDRRGRLWAGTMHGTAKNPTLTQKGQGSLYCLYTEGSIKKQVENVTLSNGLAWSADDKTMYYIDSMPGVVYGYDYDIEAGAIGNRRSIIEFERGPNGTPFPDGMTIDTEDKLWIACYYGGRVIRVDPATGERLVNVELPILRTTSCCFGDKNYDELYVTCSRKFITEEELSMYPLTGSIFKVTGLGFHGYPSIMYNGCTVPQR